MARAIVVGLFRYLTNFRKATLEVRQQACKDALTSLKMQIQPAFNNGAVSPGDIGKLNGIFVAPEYWICKAKHQSSALGPDYPIDEDQKNEFVTDFAETSRKNPQILFLPGTIAFRKSYVRPDSKSSFKAGSIIPKEHRLVKAANAFQGNYVKMSDLDDGVEFVEQKKAVFEARDRLGYFEKLGIGSGASAAGADSFIYKNQGYAFLGGEIVHKYAKKAGWYELKGTQKVGGAREIHVFPPGTKSGLKVIDGLQFGFEICRDHHAGALEAEVMRTNNSRPTIHVICSHWIDNADRATTEGGFVLHSSTANHVHGVRRYAVGNFKPYRNAANNDAWCTWISEQAIGGGSLTTWLIKIP